jgi:hypothetical protein
MIETNGMTDMYTIQEALSRARMREPQNIPSEASRSAREVAMKARTRAARERNGG